MIASKKGYVTNTSNIEKLCNYFEVNPDKLISISQIKNKSIHIIPFFCNKKYRLLKINYFLEAYYT
jgi:hypothetical protein